MSVWMKFLLAGIATSGFCIYFNAPRKSIPISFLLSGFIWIFYEDLLKSTNSYLLSGFLVACFIGITCEICAIIFRKPVTIFSLPCLLPLVPGSGMYYTMYYFIENNYDQMVIVATQTFFTASSLSLGILSSSAIFRFVRMLRKSRHNRLLF